MTFMGLHLSRRTVIACLVGLVVVAWAAGTSHAKRKQVYYFLVTEVQLADGVPQEIAERVREQMERGISAHERLIEALPEDAPDPEAKPKAFVRYIKKRRLKPFRVSVEVTDYRHEVESLPAPRRGQRLAVRIALHVFGETIPKRSMAFSGDGSSAIKLDIGKRLRERDSEVANREAIKLAVDHALTRSIERLESKNQDTRQARRRGRGKK